MDVLKGASRIRDWFIGTSKKLTALAADGLIAVSIGAAVAGYTHDPYLTISAMAGGIVIFRGGKYIFVDRYRENQLENYKNIEREVGMTEKIWKAKGVPNQIKARQTEKLLGDGKEQIDLSYYTVPGTTEVDGELISSGPVRKNFPEPEDSN